MNNAYDNALKQISSCKLMSSSDSLLAACEQLDGLEPRPANLELHSRAKHYPSRRKLNFKLEYFGWS